MVLTKNLSARILFEGGVLTAARAASAFEGPPGVALGALAGCMTGVGAAGIRTVSGLLEHLNPLRPRSNPRVARWLPLHAGRRTQEFVTWTIGVVVVLVVCLLGVLLARQLGIG